MSTTEIPWGEQKEAGPNEASRESWVIQIFRARDASFPRDLLKTFQKNISSQRHYNEGESL